MQSYWFLFLALVIIGLAFIYQNQDLLLSNEDEIQASKSNLKQMEKIKTKIECEGEDDKSGRRVCSFQNVCFAKKDRKLLYFDNENKYPSDIHVYLHTVEKFPQAAVLLEPGPETLLINTTFIEEDSYVFMRFKPDNIMHVLHDDVLPVYRELLRFYGTQSHYPVKLFIIDNYKDMPYDKIYADLSKYPLMLLNDQIQVTCFRRVIIGADRSTLWYQYGFDRPQGPLSYQPSLQALLVSYASRYSVRSMHPSNIVLFSRSETRLILNEDELLLAIAHLFGKSVITVSLETHSVEEIASIVADSQLVIGMHSAMLIMTMFLPANATVLELFPYGINASMYTPYKTVAEIMDLNYLSWMNAHRENTVGHPEYPPEYGGLADGMDEKLLEQPVRPHLCCKDPSWLYHIYQDTIVDIDEIVTLLKGVHQIHLPLHDN